MADWPAWEREAAGRALEALEAGAAAVHDALHGLLDCCAQLHPAAARHLYEAAKKVGHTRNCLGPTQNDVADAARAAPGGGAAPV